MRKQPQVNQDFNIMMTVVNSHIVQSHRSKDIKRAKQAKKDLQYGFDRNSRFMFYPEHPELSDHLMDAWIQEVLLGCGWRFTYKHNKRRYQGVFLKSKNDAIKFKNKVSEIMTNAI